MNEGASGNTPYVTATELLVGGLSPHSGSWVAFLGDISPGIEATSTLDLVLNLGGETQAQLDFYWVTFGLETGEYIFLDLYDGVWNTFVASYRGNVWKHETIDLDSSYSMIDGFIVRFRSTMDWNKEFDAAFIDDVCVYDPFTTTVTPSPSNTPTDTPTPTPTFVIPSSDTTNNILLMLVLPVLLFLFYRWYE